MSVGGREFFAVRTVAEALAALPAPRRTGAEEVAVAEASGRTPVQDVRAPHDLPGFARATVDGFAVRAADTFGASEGLPSYLDVAGAVRMGAPPDVAVPAGAAVAVPTGGVLPDGADAVVMVEHTAETMPGTIEVLRPVAPGDGLVRADEDAAAGAVLARAGRPLRAAQCGLLAAAGVARVEVFARPRVALISTGDEVVAPEVRDLRAGQVRDAIAPALAALVREAGGVPDARGIVADDPAALRAAIEAALEAGADVVVVSAGSSVGARDATAEVVAGLGEILLHGLAVKPGKPTLVARVGGIPLLGLPGNPRSALVVFGLVGVPLVRSAGGVTQPPPDAVVRARLARDVPSAAGRLDVVPVTLHGDEAIPLFGASALLSVLAAADGHVVVPEAATGLAAGTEVDVVLAR